MSIFSTILEKLGLHKEKAAATTTAPAPAASAPKPAAMPPTAPKPSVAPPAAPAASAPKQVASPTTAPAQMAQPAAPKPISEVDVVKQLEQKAKGTGLNWKVSIVDLLTLLDIDHSREARDELAKELGCQPELMSDSAKMNTWLHKTVLHKIAENGGNIPKDLLD
ncbi:MAG TPA: DUF3597 domain-containing protein [Anaerolineales bacterium]|nr:DUF3597 domain-containing protein [Anaerolineales bacterium]